MKPRQIIEVGSGNSTLLMSAAGTRNANEGYDFQLTSVDPNASSYLSTNPPQFTTVLTKSVESLSVKDFESLEKNDFLFIDSSHNVKCGSDVLFLILNVVPALNAGVIVHIHDIYLPFEYPRQWLENGFYYNESYFLHAFLLFNKDFEILLSNHYLNRRNPDRWKEMFGDPAGPTSLWLRRVE